MSKPGSLGKSLTKVLADHDSVDSRNRIRETCADPDRETVVSTVSSLLADYDSVDSRNSIREICADMDRETVVSTLFSSESEGKRDRDQNVVQSSRDSENLHKILERKAELAVGGEKMAQQKF